MGVKRKIEAKMQNLGGMLKIWAGRGKLGGKPRFAREVKILGRRREIWVRRARYGCKREIWARCTVGRHEVKGRGARFGQEVQHLGKRARFGQDARGLGNGHEARDSNWKMKFGHKT